jgi:[acyl-carrier-protein] S-malonyltransferase
MAEFALLCPGQGSQAPDMFDLVTTDAIGRDTLAQFSDALGMDLLARARLGQGLFDNAFAQVALVGLACATWAALAPRLPAPGLFAGYSVGELSAWACAGAWDAPGAATAAATRARLMDADSPPGCGMLAARGLALADLQALAAGLEVAIVNDLDHAVFAGRQTELAAAQTALAARGAWTRRLDVQVPSHTALLRGAAQAFGDWLATQALRPLAAPVLRGIDGRRCLRSAEAVSALQRAVCEPIRWDQCLHGLLESGIDLALEIGPGRSLAKLSADVSPSLRVRSVADFRSIAGVADWLNRQLESR